MKRETYDQYLSHFNARNYDALLDYFAEEFEVVFAGYRLKSRQQLKAFYRFLHEYVDENIQITRYWSDENSIALEANVRLEGKKDLSPDLLKEKNLSRLGGLQAGQVVVIPQFIHYHLHNGKFTHALCAVYQAPDTDVNLL